MHVGLVQRLHAAEPLHVLVCFSIMASIMSSTVTMPITWPAASTTGTARRSYFEISRAASSRLAVGETASGRRPGATLEHVVFGSPAISRRSGTALVSARVRGSSTKIA